MCNTDIQPVLKPQKLCNFKFESSKYGQEVNVNYDLEFPLGPYLDFNILFGHFVTETGLQNLFIEDAKAEFYDFILRENNKNEEELVDEMVENFLSNNEFRNDFDYEQKFKMDFPFTKPSQVKFDDRFKEVMKTSQTKELMKLIKLESQMSNVMNKMLLNRDTELDRLRDICEQAVEQTKAAEDMEEHSYNLSMLNEKFRVTNTNFCHQIQALIAKQKSEFGDSVDELSKTGFLKVENNSFKDSSPTSNKSTMLPDHQPKLEESYTIYIGNQMKTMHNARILQYNKLTELCHDSFVEELGEDVHASSRLNLLMSLYRRDLKATVILVERDPLYHVHARSEFFKLCEKSVELHFDTLEGQLRKVAETISPINQSHRHTLPHQRCFDSAEPRCPDDFEFFRPGDVYVTCHSNLNNVHVVFHLVTDQHWDKIDITSRHPYVNGLRNCVRLASRNAIGTLSLPLFLNKNVPKDQSSSYYQSRADLMFKCMKGFLMEVCSTGASSTAGAPFSARNVHYNINFGVPEKLGRVPFETITDVFLQIFHLVPIVNG